MRTTMDLRRSASGKTKFQLHTVRGKLVRPELDLDRTSSLIVTDDESEYSGQKQRDDEMP